jgi:hypothetical protein
MTGANLATSNVRPEAYCSVAPRPAVPSRRPDEGSFPKQPQWLCADVPDYIDLKKFSFSEAEGASRLPENAPSRRRPVRTVGYGTSLADVC